MATQTKILSEKSSSNIQSGDELLAYRNGAVERVSQASMSKRAGEVQAVPTALNRDQMPNNNVWYRIAKLGLGSVQGNSAIIKIGTLTYGTIPSSSIVLCVSKGYVTGGTVLPSSERVKIDVVSSFMPYSRSEPFGDVAFPKARIVSFGNNAYLDVFVSRANGISAVALGEARICDTFENVTDYTGTVDAETPLIIGSVADTQRAIPVPFLAAARNTGTLKEAIIEASTVSRDIRVFYFLAPTNIITNWGDNSTAVGTGSTWTLTKISSYSAGGPYFTYIATCAAATNVYLLHYVNSVWTVKKLATDTIYTGA